MAAMKPRTGDGPLEATQGGARHRDAGYRWRAVVDSSSS